MQHLMFVGMGQIQAEYSSWACVPDVRYTGTQVQYSTGQPATATATAAATATATATAPPPPLAVAVAVAVAGWGIWPPWDSGRKTRFSNGLAYNRSKVSVKKSKIGFVVINFSRSIFPYMSNIYDNG